MKYITLIYFSQLLFIVVLARPDVDVQDACPAEVPQPLQRGHGVSGAEPDQLPAVRRPGTRRRCPHAKNAMGLQAAHLEGDKGAERPRGAI